MLSLLRRDAVLTKSAKIGHSGRLRRVPFLLGNPSSGSTRHLPKAGAPNDVMAAAYVVLNYWDTGICQFLVASLTLSSIFTLDRRDGSFTAKVIVIFIKSSV
jgi:hypothetical protein